MWMGIIPVFECFEVPLRLKEKLDQAEGTRWARGGSQRPREQRRTRPMLLMMRVVTMMQMRFAFLRVYCRWCLKPANRFNRKKSKPETPSQLATSSCCICVAVLPSSKQQQLQQKSSSNTATLHNYEHDLQQPLVHVT